MSEIAWPPPYTVKKHPRARSVKLRTTLERGLEFIVPPRFNVKHIPSLLIEHKDWIEQQLQKFALENQVRIDAALPETIFLPAIQQTWRVDYIPCQTRLKLISRPQREIVLLGDIQNKTACKKLLKQWVKQQAKLHLPKMLTRISDQLQMAYTKVSIRDQLTRLGSCSADKTISLNYRLLLLPEELAVYVMIHELCHTVHLNHSEEFWQLVAKYDEQWKINRQKARKMDALMPAWLV